MNLQKAVIASEDGTFLHHHGFDFSAMQQAFRNNANGKKSKGVVLYRNKPPRMCFYGREEVTLEKR